METEERKVDIEFFSRGKMVHPKRKMLHMIRRIHDKMERDGTAMLKELDMTFTQGHVLGFLTAHGGTAPLKDLEKALHVAQSTSAGLVARLEKRGYISNCQDPNDKRIKIVSITTSGKNAMQQVGEIMIGLESEITSPLSKEESEMFSSLMQKIIAGFDGKN